ncbi:MAG: LysM peptidoglycan-binding domain-containing protein [Pseudohongiellaceae bacterium]
MQKTLIIFVILALLLTGGCGNQGYIPVYTAGERLTGNHYLVRHGDTLYSIAFRFGLDYRTLAVANNIQPPYTIFVNQRIRLAPVAAAAADKPSSKSNSTSAENTIASEVKRSLPTTTPKIPDTSIQWRWPYEGEVVNRFP